MDYPPHIRNFLNILHKSDTPHIDDFAVLKASNNAHGMSCIGNSFEKIRKALIAGTIDTENKFYECDTCKELTKSAVRKSCYYYCLPCVEKRKEGKEKKLQARIEKELESKEISDFKIRMAHSHNKYHPSQGSYVHL